MTSLTEAAALRGMTLFIERQMRGAETEGLFMGLEESSINL